jgi:hypothetical protein
MNGETEGEETMRHARKLRRRGVLVLCATAAAVLVASASADVVYQETIHDERTFVESDFCDSPGLEVTIASTLDLRVHVVPRGPDGLAYFLQHGRQSDVLTANGTSLTSIATVTEKDHEITVNDDGTLTIVVLATGNAVLYGPDGKAIARNPGSSASRSSSTTRARPIRRTTSSPGSAS